MKICLHNPHLLMRRPISKLSYLLSDIHEITILTPKTEKQNLHHMKYLKKDQIITYNNYNLPIKFEWPIVGLDFIFKLEKVCKENDIIHMWTNSYLSTLIISLYVKSRNLLSKKKVRTIISFDTIPGESFKFNSWLDTAYYVFNRTIGKLQIKLADHISLYCNSLIPFFTRISNKKYSINPTGIFTDKKSDAKISLSDKKRVTFIGIPGLRKGIDRLVRVAAKLPEIEFLVIGDGPERKEWENKSTNNMKFMGRNSAVEYILENSDCFFFPSRGEGLAGVILESMKMKCPVITTPIVGTIDIIEHEKEGYLIDGDDTEKIIEKINYVLDKKNKKEIDLIRKRAFEKVSKDYNWTNNVKSYLKMYEEVI